MPESQSLNEIAETILGVPPPECDAGLRFDHRTLDAAIHFQCHKENHHDGPHSHGSLLDGIRFVVVWSETGEQTA